MLTIDLSKQQYKQDDILYLEIRWQGKSISPELRGWNLLSSWQQGRTHVCGWWRKVYDADPIVNPVLWINDPDVEYDLRVIHAANFTTLADLSGQFEVIQASEHHQ